MTRRPLTPRVAAIKVGEMRGVNLDTLLAQYLRLAAIDDATPSTEPDGLRGRDYTADSRPATCLCDPEGPSGERCPHGTTTERGALTPAILDELREHRLVVSESIRLVAHMLTLAESHLERAFNRRDIIDLNPPPGCQAMERVDHWEAIHAKVVVDGKEWALGNWAYRFTRDRGRLPSPDECRQRARGRRVMVKD
jgi:hypothetical protein